MRNNVVEEPESLFSPLSLKALISWHLLYPGVGENISPGKVQRKFIDIMVRVQGAVDDE